MLLRLCPASRLTQEGSDLAFMGSNIAAFNRTAFFWKIRFYFWKAKKLLLMWAKCYNRGFEFTKGLIFFLCAVVPPICWLTYTTYISLDSILVHTHTCLSKCWWKISLETWVDESWAPKQQECKKGDHHGPTTTWEKRLLDLIFLHSHKCSPAKII